MRRGMVIMLVLLAILGAIAVGVGAYKAGLSAGLAETGRAGEAVRVVDHDRFGIGFPFGLILFPLLLFGIFALAKAAFWHGGWGGPGPGGWGPAPWMHGGPFEEWHRRQHEPGSDQRGPGTEPSTA